VNANDIVESVIWTDCNDSILDTALFFYDILSSDMQNPKFAKAYDLSGLYNPIQVTYWTKSMVTQVVITQSQAKDLIGDELVLELSDFSFETYINQLGLSMSYDTIVWYCNGNEVKNSTDTSYFETLVDTGTFNYSIKIRAIHTNEWPGYPANNSIRWYDSDTTQIHVDFQTSFSNINKEKEIFKVYPNPTSEYVNFTENIEYEICDINGRKMCFGIGEKVNVCDFNTGVFFIKTKYGTEKFIKI